MFKRSLLMILLALILVSFLATETPALIRTTLGGGLYLKCVEGFVKLVALGNVENVPTWVLLKVFVAKGEEDETLPSWVVICGNPGTDNWTAPGINIAYFETNFGGIESIDPEDVLKNGSAYVTVPAAPTETMLTALATLACPNPNWIAWDAAPCSNMKGVFEEIIYVDGQCFLRSKLTYENCYIEGCPDSVSYTWDDINQAFTFVPTPYTCPEAPALYSPKNPELYNGDGTCPTGIPQ